ncbi:MAG TPA: hypothetical protein VI078_06870 [bacterium]
MDRAPEKTPAANRALLAAALAGLCCLVTTLLYGERFARVERGVQRVTAAYASAEFEKPALTLPAPFPDRGRLTDPAWGPVPVRMARDLGVATTALQDGAVYYWTPIYRYQSAGPQPLVVAPDVHYAPALKTAKAPPGPARPVAIALCVLVAALAAGLLASARGRPLFVQAGSAGLRLASLLWMFGVFGFFSIYINDEERYFRISEKLLSWGASYADYRYPIGLPLLYTPLRVVSGIVDPQRFVLLFSALSFLTIGLGVVVALLRLLPRDEEGGRMALGAGLALALYPWLATLPVFRVAGGARPATLLGLVVSLPVEVNFPLARLFATWVGYNALSDTPAVFFGLLALLALRRRDGRAWLLAGGALLGFACLVRLTAVFLLLPAAWVLWQRRDELDRGGLAAFLGGLAAVGSLQLLWNRLVLGDFLVFGYVSDARAYQGFEWRQLPAGMRVLGQAHYQLLVFAGGALLLLAKRRPACATLLGLLAGPTFVYLLGYYFVPNDPLRLTLLPLTVMLAAVGAAGALLRGERAWWFFAAFVATLLFSPVHPRGPLFVTVPVWLGPACWVALAAVVAARTREWLVPLLLVLCALRLPVAAVGFFLACLGAIVVEQFRTGGTLAPTPAGAAPAPRG